MGSSAITATAVAASIKWIIKDGVGTLGRLFVGGRLGLFIDEDPRLWRMVAEAFSTVGLALEIGTVFFPNQFLILAGTGNFAKALAKGIANPAFRVIQQHFARKNNIGEVSAKEESWEVAGQLTGLLTSVAILNFLQDAGTWKPILGTWIGFQSIHIVCRFLALKSLRLDTLNLVRATHLITSHINDNPLPDPQLMSLNESFLTDWTTSTPPIQFGCSLKECHISENFAEWIEIFKEELFLLNVKDQGRVVLKEKADGKAVLKALWLYMWLRCSFVFHPSLDQLRYGLIQTNLRFPEFVKKATHQGWNMNNLVFKIQTIRIQTL